MEKIVYYFYRIYLRITTKKKEFELFLLERFNPDDLIILS